MYCKDCNHWKNENRIAPRSNAVIRADIAGMHIGTCWKLQRTLVECEGISFDTEVTPPIVFMEFKYIENPTHTLATFGCVMFTERSEVKPKRMRRK